MANSNAELMRKWFRTCPLLERTNKFRVDYLGEVVDEYAIFVAQDNIKYHENVLGEAVMDELQEVNYTFASKRYFGSDDSQNIENLDFFQGVSDWIYAQNLARNFPDMVNGRIISMMPTVTSSITQATDDSARYQINIKVTYKRYQ